MRFLTLAASLFAAASPICAQRALENEARPYMEFLPAFAAELDPKWQTGSYAVPTRAEDLRKALDDMAKLSAVMAKYPGAKPDVGVPPRDIRFHPEEWGKIAGARNEVAKKIVARVVNESTAADVKIVRDRIARFDSSEGWSGGEFSLNLMLGKRDAEREKVIGAVKPLLAVVGMADPSAAMTEFEKACDELINLMKGSAGKWASKYTHPDAAIAARITAGYAKNFPDRKIVRIGFSKPDWAVKLNALGRPISRSKQGSIVYRVPQIPQLIERTLIVIEDYKGSGYVNRPVAQDAAIRLVSK